MTYGGNGHGSGAGATQEDCSYMFSNNTDTKGSTRPNWSEVTASNTPADRRFVESAGPFTIKPGGVYYLTYAVIWAQAPTGDNLASVTALQVADIKIQEVFNSCMSSSAVGINEAYFNKSESIAFPNPFSTQTQLYINPSVIRSGSTLKVLDITGRCVKTLYNVQAGYITIDRDGLNAGTYLYQVENNGKPLTQGKLVIE